MATVSPSRPVLGPTAWIITVVVLLVIVAAIVVYVMR
jgi:hypothetical protein